MVWYGRMNGGECGVRWEGIHSQLRVKVVFCSFFILSCLADIM